MTNTTYVDYTKFIADYSIKNGDMINELKLNQSSLRLKKELNNVINVLNILNGNDILFWNTQEPYLVNDLVQVNNTYYRAVMNNINEKPNNSSDAWTEAFNTDYTNIGDFKNFLSKNNNVEYIPTHVYNPSTKGYTDSQDNYLRIEFDEKIYNLTSTKADISYVDNKSHILNNTKADKFYVDALISGLDAKEAVKVASIDNIDLTTGGLLTIDDEALKAGDRVLVKNQSNLPDNGIYIVVDGAWVRSADADNNPDNEVKNGMYVFATNGTVNKNTSWILSSPDNPINLGITNLTFSKFSNITMNSGDILSKLKTVDGSGSGLDADLLDGKDSTLFVRSDVESNFTSLSGGHITTVSKGNDILGTSIKSQGDGENIHPSIGFVQPNKYDSFIRLQQDGFHFMEDGSNNADITVLGINVTSDVRKKNNIEKIKNTSEVLSKIDGVYFNWKKGKNNKRQAGVIAQTVEKVFPEAVNTDDLDNKTVNYNAIIGLLIEEVKLLRKEINFINKEKDTQ